MTDSPKKAVDSGGSSPSHTDSNQCQEISLCLFRFEIADTAPFIDLDFTVHGSSASWMPNTKKKNRPFTPSGKTSSDSGTENTVQRSASSSLAVPTEIQKYRGQRSPIELSIETFEATPPRELDTGSVERVNFFSGNPFVEKTEGLLHIYKKNEMTALRDEEGQRSEMLCMLAVPSTLTSHDLLKFIAPSSAGISKIRIIRDQSPNQYMVLIRFRDQKMADEFYRNYEGMTFNSLEPNACQLVYVAQVETMKEFELPGVPVEGHTELPTCPVCLERMDESVDGILTILCNHSFHGACLSQWGDTSCPVCRYCQTPELTPENKCFTCSKQNDLWICLICGHIGCGRYEEAHAFQHFQETQHTFSLQMGSQRVWDYAGDNYVHRLIQTKEDGKVVEYEPSTRNPADVEGDEKIEGITLEYTYLLTNQLESQRKYFESKLDTIEQTAQSQVENLEAQMTRVLQECDKFKKEVKELNDKKTQAEKKLQVVTAKLEKVSSELKDEQMTNKLLRGEQQKWVDQVKELDRKLKDVQASKEKEVTSMEEQMRDLMFHLEGREKLKKEGPVEAEEIREGTMLVGEATGGTKKHRKKKK